MTARALSFQVTPAEHGERLDAVVRRRSPDLSRRLLRELFARGDVTVDGRRAKKGSVVHAGAEVDVALPPPDVARSNPHLELTIRLESPDWVIVDKPAGMPSTARGGGDLDSVANALMARYPDMSGFGYHAREAGLVHRLDTHTSGLLLAAKREPAFLELRAALRGSLFDKRYLALTPVPPFEHGRIESGLGADPARRGRVLVQSVEHESVAVAPRPPGPGRRASEYRVLERKGALALLEVRVGAAYRHQVRAQLAAIGLPILGDATYGSRVALSRHALHACHLAYDGGENAVAFVASSGLPEDLLCLFDEGLAT